MVLIGVFIGRKRDNQKFPSNNNFLQKLDELDNDGVRWKKLGEGYIIIGLGALCLELAQWITQITNYSLSIEWITQNLLGLFTTTSPSLVIAGIGMTLFAFGASLLDGQIIKANLEKLNR